MAKNMWQQLLDLSKDKCRSVLQPRHINRIVEDSQHGL